MDKVIECIADHCKENTIKSLADSIGVSPSFIAGIMNWKHDRYRVLYVDRLYDYFKIEKDKRYTQNLRRWNAKTFSVIGSILRLARVKAWYTIEDVAKITRGDKRQIHRIEQWDSLPSFQSYYIVQMMELYEMSEQEREKISRGICILQDLTRIHKRYDENR